MRDEEILLYAGLGIAALYLYKDVKGAFAQKPMKTENVVASIQAAGGNVNQGALGTFWVTPGGTVRLDGGDWTPNFAQNVLVGVDRVIPGDWLSRKVFGL